VNWNDYEMKREQVKDYLREAEQDRLARKLPRRRIEFDFRCWLSSRVDYLRATLAYAWRRARHLSAPGQSVPVLADCK
jgi:hypothetical protein